MSCGGLHEKHHGEGHGGYDHGGPLPGWDEKYPFIPAGGDEDPAAAGHPVSWEEGQPEAAASHPGQHAAPKEPGRIRVAAAGAWDQHGYMVKPFAWAAAVDGTAIFVHQIAAPLWALGITFAGGLTAEIATEIRNHRRKRSSTWRALTRKLITAGTLWALIAAAWTPFGWKDIVQWIALAGGGAMAGSFVHEVRKAIKADARREPDDEPGEPLAIEPPRRVDPRLQAFIGRFCQPGEQLDGVEPERFRELAYGFMFEIYFPPYLRHSQADVENLRVLIAKLYNVTRNDVSVGYVPDHMSEARCQVVIRTVPAAAARDRAPGYNRWDGETTWDAATGLTNLGRYLDETITHYRLNTPRSGAGMGLFAGVPGSGKTGTMNVVAADAGLAMLCSRCGQARTCGICDLHRVWAVWLGDPQKQGFSVWRGRADLMGWGAEGCVELFELTEAVAEARTRELSSMEWWDTGPDGRRRHNTGKGWFDPEIGFPGIFLGLDELPKLAKHKDQDLAKAGLRIICNGIMEWRKVGIHPAFGTQSLDLAQIGVREIRDMIRYLNAVAHRCDEGTGDMAGVTGDPRTLPDNDPGVGFIAGPDGRPGDRFNVKIMPETLKPGMTGLDIRHLAGIIASTPIRYDRGTASVLEAWQTAHQEVITEWRGRADEAGGLGGYPAPAGLAAAPAQEGTGVDGLPYREDADKVLAVLAGRPGGTDIVGLMQATELDLGSVCRAVDALAAAGQITKTDDTYRAA